MIDPQRQVGLWVVSKEGKALPRADTNLHLVTGNIKPGPKTQVCLFVGALFSVLLQRNQGLKSSTIGLFLTCSFSQANKYIKLYGKVASEQGMGRGPNGTPKSKYTVA